MPPLYIDRIYAGRLVPPGQTITMLGVSGSREKITEFNRFFYSDTETGPDSLKAVVELTYASVYEDTWITHSDWESPKALP